MKYHFNIYRKDNGACLSDGIEIPDCTGKGDTIDDLWENLRKTLNIYLDDAVAAGQSIPMPDSSLKGNEEVISIPVDIKLAFPIIMKNIRKERNLSIDDAAMLMGLASKSSYKRLEQKCNPNLETMQRVFNAFPEFPIERVLSMKISPE